MDEFYDRVNELVVDLLVPARITKVLNREAYEKLCAVLQEIDDAVKGKEDIPQKLAGLLFFLYCSLSDQIKGKSYTDELFRAVGTMEGYLRRILDAPF